ncbi:MAG: heme exporter protein CcmD [Deltaproteobacteria bacterium]
MIDLGKYAVTVLSAYGATLVLLGGLVIWTMFNARKARRELTQIETRLRAGEST